MLKRNELTCDHLIALLAAAALAAVIAPAPAHARQAADRQQATGADHATRPDVVRDHIDAADDLVDSLLGWRHVNTNVRGGDRAIQDNTMIAVDANQIERLRSVLAAIGSSLPPSPTGSTAGGDLRAHARKAEEIAQELGPKTPPAAVGTSGSSGRNAASPAAGPAQPIVTIDRTALQRLEVEIDAMKLLAPRAR